VIRSVLFLEPLGGDPHAIEQFFVSEGVLEHASATPGFVSAELQLPEDRTAPAMVTALWTSRQAYQRWVEDPWRAASAERGRSVYRAIEQPGGGGSLYEVKITVGGPSRPVEEPQS
jgi:heme-degrading monooxygenase HmoA